MAQPKPPKPPREKIEIEPGADKRLASILKKALNTPTKSAQHQQKKAKKTTISR
jgi:hypothetical protein